MRLLDDAALQAVYDRDVRSYLFTRLRVRRASQPRLIIVGGQPGCGKSGAVLVASHELRAASAGAGAAVINGDELRARHPHYKRLVQEDRATAADKTGADVGAWVERGIRDAAAGGFNTVIETTMRQPAVVLATAQVFKDAGHQVELRVLIVDPEISQLAIYQRFAGALTTRSALPRFTLPRYHEEALAKMPQTLQDVTNNGAGPVAIVRLVNRAGDELHSSQGTHADLAEVFGLYRRAQLSPAQVQRIDADWRALRATLDRAGVPELVREGVRNQQERFSGLAKSDPTPAVLRDTLPRAREPER